MPYGDEVREGFIVQLTGMGGDDRNNKFFKILRREWFKYKTGDGPTAEYSSVAVGARSSFVEIENLRPAKSPPRLFWVAWGVQFGGEYRFMIKAGSSRLGTDRVPTTGILTNRDSPYFDMDREFSFWLIYDYAPAIEFNNTTRVATVPVIHFLGYKYDIQPIQDPTLLAQIQSSGKFSVITVGGVEMAQVTQP